MFEVLYIGSIFCALLTIYLLLFKENAIKSYSNYILSAILFLEIYFVIIYLLIYTSLINELPLLYKTAAPFNFLIAPMAYLYVKSVLFNKKGLSAIDFLHFLPFVFAIINYLPFFLIPIAEKKWIVQLTSDDISYAFRYQAGYLPEYVIFVFKIIQSILYLIVQWKLIVDFKKENKNIPIESQIKKVVKWLKIFSGIFTTILFGFFFMAFFFYVLPLDSYFEFINLVQSLLLSVSFFTLSTYILLNPAILDGLPFVKYRLQASSILNQQESRPFIVENFENEIAQIEAYMKEQEVFLNPKITLTQVSAALQIPIRDLSYIINNHFDVRFNDYINQYRVNYFSKMLADDYLSNYTIDSLIQKAGFSSKSTFHAAFKKIHHCTPSQYISNQKANC